VTASHLRLRRWARVFHGRERGSTGGADALEMVLLAPILLVVLLLIIGAGRISVGAGKGDQAAAVAARAASLEHSADAAQASASAVAASTLADSGVTCQTVNVVIDTSGFGAPAGTPSSIVVDVTCSVALSDLAIPGLPGSYVLSGHAASPLDIHQERG
jgi:Flp pilus assembly protein TadG